MSQYRVTFHAPIEVIVTVEADSEDDAADGAWRDAEDFLQTVYGNGRGVRFYASLDGIGADSVALIDEEQS